VCGVCALRAANGKVTITSETDELLRQIEHVAERTIAPAAAAVDRLRTFPTESIEALGDAGALGLLVPRAHGGAGAGLPELAQACETVGGACASTGMVFLMHCVCAATIAGGDGENAAELLRSIADERVLGTLAFSERGTGAHFYAPELTARRDGEHLRISGHKSFVTSGGCADLYLVLVRAGDGDELDCYAIPAQAEGLSFKGAWEGLGMAGNSSVAMVLEDVALGEDARIGGPGGGGALVFDVVAPTFLIGLAAVNIGIAAAAHGAATRHAAMPRYADGSALADVQVIQHALAQMEITLRGARGLVRDAAGAGAEAADDALIAIMSAKVAACEAAELVTARALEVCGGQGYTPSLPVERHLRDARAGRVMAPTNAVLLSWIGKALAGLPVP
jgi:alkylation response protein AidB-like acyl-CoA dehydrogenase